MTPLTSTQPGDLDEPLPSPYADIDTNTVIVNAVEALAWQRSPHGPGDPLLTVHLLLSLQQQIPARLHMAVEDARTEGYTWTQIAEQLGVTPTTVRRRYADSYADSY